MAVNFQALSPLQAQASPMQALPSAPQQPSAIQQLGQGLTGAVQAYQNAELNDKQGQLLDQKIETGKMDVEERKQKFQDGQTIRASAKQGEEQYIKTMMEVDPPGAMAYLKTKKEIEKLSAETFKTNAEGEKISGERYDQMMSSIGDIVATADAWRDPTTGQPMDEQRKAQFIMGGVELVSPSAVKFIQKISPNGYNQQTSIALQILGMQSNANIMDKNSKSATPSDTAKRQAEIRQQKALIAKMPQGSPERIQAEQELSQLEQGLNKTIAPAQSMVANPYEDAYAKEGEKAAAESATQRKQLVNFRTFNDNVREQLPKVSGYSLGPIASAIKLDKLDPQAQVLESTLSATTAFAKNVVGLKGGAQGMTEKEWDMIRAIAGGTFMNKYSLKQVTETMNRVSYVIENREWENENNFRKNLPKDKYDTWLASNPEPVAKVKVGDKMYSVPVKKMDEFIKDSNGVLQ